ncbi:MAG TPA: serine/threonine-protein kinase [Holophagaceae bacterium]|nr:serine/threonine-protein kinase [Holophagaceae bacterium]
MLHRLGKYELLGSLGQGAMGEVFLAKDPAIGRRVAIKTILAASSAGEDAKERFAQEARAAGALSHPGIVTIHEFGEDQGLHYLAMEFVEGEDLQAFLVHHELSRPDLLEVLAQVSEALAYAHRKGVQHRDVKPSNIRVSREGGRLQAKLMDFGIARIAESTLTSTGLLMGTVAYMAPEYVKTGQADGRADLFAIGVMLYEGLTGRLPFAADTTATILYRIVHEPPHPLPPSAFAGASAALRSVLDHALAKDPERRYSDGDSLAAALRAAKDPLWAGEFATTRAVPHLKALPPREKKRRVAPVAALIVVLGGGAFLWRHRRPAAPAMPAQAPPPTAPAPLPTVSAPLPAPAAKPAPPPVASHETAKPESKPKAPPPPVSPAAGETDLPAMDAPADALSVAKEIDDDPAQAHRDLAGLIRKSPANAHFRALDLVALEKAGDGAGFVKAWDAAAAAGVDPNTLLFTPRFSAMLREQKRNATLPQDARDRLSQAYGAENPRRWGRRVN